MVGNTAKNVGEPPVRGIFLPSLGTEMGHLYKPCWVLSNDWAADGSAGNAATAAGAVLRGELVLMGRWILIISLGLLSACAMSEESYLPDGRKGHAISCSGTALTWNDCYKKAGEICRERGYTVVDGGSERGQVSSRQFSGPVIIRNMMIACK